MVETRMTDGRVNIEQRANGVSFVWGYAAVFYRENSPGTEYQLADGLVERIGREAFARALAERDDARALFNHDPSNLLARVGADTLRLSADGHGLRYEFDIDPADTDHERVVRKIERGDLSGSSFSFVITDQRFVHQEEGPDVRWINGVELWDVGPVTFPAYEATTAGTRAANGVSEALDAWSEWKRAEAADALGARLARSRRLAEIELARKR